METEKFGIESVEERKEYRAWNREREDRKLGNRKERDREHENRGIEKTESRAHRAEIGREGERGRRQILERNENQEKRQES
jgi:hypothetical protein